MSRGASSDQRERDQVFIENQREQLQEEPAQASSSHIKPIKPTFSQTEAMPCGGLYVVGSISAAVRWMSQVGGQDVVAVDFASAECAPLLCLLPCL